MAIQKQKTNNQGIGYDYWVAETISDIHNKKTQVCVCGFINQDTRNSRCAYIERLFVGTMDGLYHTGEEVYKFIKASKTEKVQKIDEKGNKIDKFDDVEQNWFADAKDC
jgi:hypothetical protein